MASDISEVKRKYSPKIMKIPNVNGIGIERSNTGDKIIKVFVEKLTDELNMRIPKELEGYKVEIEEVGEVYFQ